MNISPHTLFFQWGTNKVIEEMKYMIKHLNEDELRSLLLQFFLQMHTVEEKNDYSAQQFFLDIKKTYNHLLEDQKNQANVEPHTQFQTTHIVFGDSPTGSLKIALKTLGLNQQERIISFSDLFSIGSIWRLHDSQGVANRYEWLKTHLNIDDDVLLNYQAHFKRSILELEQTPSHHSIIIWAGENAHEQTGLRFILYLLKEKEKTNDILIINTNEAYKNHFNRTKIDFTPLHMGELSSEQLTQIYENEKNGHVLTQMERNVFKNEWMQLCEEQDVLRIWEGHKIMSVPETFYDEYIIHTVKKFHQKKNHKDFIKAARIIGEVIGHVNQYVGDQFIEYRVRRLIVDGVFDMEGVPKAMRSYSIKMR